MARTWLQVWVELEGGRDLVLDPAPGRILIVGPAHTFSGLAAGIDAAFARWDLAHLHQFELPDGRLIGSPNIDLPEVLDSARLKVARELSRGEEFRYTFDLGDNWRHRCHVLTDKVDPLEVYGEMPAQPVSIWGWGWIPDQYGRETPDGEPEE